MACVALVSNSRASTIHCMRLLARLPKFYVSAAAAAAAAAAAVHLISMAHCCHQAMQW
jgi:hypothetical protein